MCHSSILAQPCPEETNEEKILSRFAFSCSGLRRHSQAGTPKQPTIQRLSSRSNMTPSFKSFQRSAVCKSKYLYMHSTRLHAEDAVKSEHLTPRTLFMHMTIERRYPGLSMNQNLVCSGLRSTKETTLSAWVTLSRETSTFTQRRRSISSTDRHYWWSTMELTWVFSKHGVFISLNRRTIQDNGTARGPWIGI